MTGVFEAVSRGFAWSAAVIATLQAGSRALYAVSNDNELGVMDGPLILSPFDVRELERRGEEAEVSSLWEITFGFSEAVRLLHDTSSDGSGSGNVDCGFDVKTATWNNGKKSSEIYSMASPHKSVPNENDDVHRTNNNTDSTNEHGLNETSIRSLVVSTAATNDNDNDNTSSMLPETYTARTLEKIRSSYSYVWSYFNNLSYRAKLMISMFYDPTTELQSARRTHRYSDVNVEEDDERIDDASLDYDDIRFTTVQIPKDLDDNFGETNTTKVANIKAFAPQTFQKLRSRFGVKEEDFLKSMLESGPYVSFQSNSKGAARAGGFFFFTRDGAYMIKTIKKAEIKTILEMLPKYCNFMRRNSRRSLLTRFCGLYSVQLNDDSGKRPEEEFVFLIMNSVFPAEGSKFITERFDLKGSTVGRECSLKERKEKGSQAVLKDLDLEREVNVMKSLSPSFGLGDYGISIGPTAKSALLSQLRRDLNLLVSCSVMDYSLLVGVVNLDHTDSKSKTVISAKDEIEKVLDQMSGRQKKGTLSLAGLLATPIKQLIAPGVFVGQLVCTSVTRTLSSVFTPPFPYHGASLCGVDGGALSILTGKRLGNRALYYIGVIDFLQPWTTQKILEKELKGFMGYEKTAISCAHPKDYAERFLEFMDKNIT